MIRLGMFGGTFDPVHYGHLRTTESARAELGLEKLLMIPNPRPPHKESENLTPYLLRKEMLRLALEEFPYLELAAYEEDVEGPAYTTDTVKRVIAALPNGPKELWLIIGADSLIELPLWKDPEALFRDTRVAVLPRPGCDLASVNPHYLARATLLKTPLQEISATEIRRRIQTGEDTSGMLPRSVIDFIRANRLYGGHINPMPVLRGQ